MGDTAGSVKALWRFPVWSMLGEQLEEAELAAGGFAGDRAYALIDAASGKVLSGRTPRLGPLLLRCRAAFCQPPAGPDDRPPARITLGVMTTLAHNDLPRDLDVLRTLVRHNRIDVVGGAYPCAGVYATVVSGGTIRAGDRVLPA